MTATLIAILSLTVLGTPVTLAVDRRARGLLLVGASFLYGSGTMFLTMLLLSMAHLRWTLINITVCALIVFCVSSILARRRPLATDRRRGFAFHVADLVTIIALFGFALYATIRSLWEWDFWAIWGLKATVFLERGGIDWRFLERGWNAFAHPDYPLLVPLNFDFVALVSGSWSDRWLGLLFVAWGVALLLIVRALASRETSPFVASLLTMTVTSLAVSLNLGMAEGALIAFGGAGILFLRAAMFDGDASMWRHGALMLGFAANCKNEGIALLVAVTIAVAVGGSRGLAVSQEEGNPAGPGDHATARLFRLWPAYALIVPWLVLRLIHVLPTDIAGGSAIARFAGRLPHLLQILGLLAAQVDQPAFWVAILAGILIAPAAARRRERFVFLVTGMQLMFYVAAYFATPYDLNWHVSTSWSRLTGQIALPLTFSVFLMLANSLRGSQDAPHAEARSDH